MRSPALALTGLVWLRYRWGLAVCAAVWLALAAVALLVPRSVWAAGPEDGPLLPVHFVFGIGTFPLVLTYVVCAFSYLDAAPLEARESAFPVRMFTLPVPTAALVFWPMLQAAAAVALLWVAWVGAVLRPAGLDVPLLWPAILVANVMVWVQAVA